MRAGVGTSTHSNAADAGREAARAALKAAGAAESALLFAGPGYADDATLLVDAAADALGTDHLVGATGYGVFGAGREHEGEASVSCLAFSGLEAQPFLLPDPAGEEREVCEQLAAWLGGPLSSNDLLVLLPDPRSFDPGVFLPHLRESVGDAVVVGAGAGDPLGGDPLLWSGRTLASGGIAGLVLRCSRPPRVGVTQACRPVTELLTVTRSQGHWVHELDGRPALDVFREVAMGPLASDLARAASFLLVALPASDAPRLEPGSYLLRHLVGFDEAANTFAIPAAVKPGDRLALAMREPEAAREDLKEMLAGLGGPPEAFGLYFDCCARGAGFFGVPGLEAAYLEQACGSAPLAGIFGSCEIGPVGDRTELLTYTGVLALVDG